MLGFEAQYVGATLQLGQFVSVRKFEELTTYTVF